MKRFPIIILLLTSAACWGQTITVAKADTGGKVATFRVSKKPDTIGKIEQMPEFPGGEDALMNFLRKNINYPDAAKAKNIEGKVFLTFVVQTDGAISDVKIMRDIGGGCGDEAVRVVKLMPNWTPGKSNGVPVNTQFVLPISFELSSQ